MKRIKVGIQQIMYPQFALSPVLGPHDFVQWQNNSTINSNNKMYMGDYEYS